MKDLHMLIDLVWGFDPPLTTSPANIAKSDESNSSNSSFAGTILGNRFVILSPLPSDARTDERSYDALDPQDEYKNLIVREYQLHNIPPSLYHARKRSMRRLASRTVAKFEFEGKTFVIYQANSAATHPTECCQSGHACAQLPAHYKDNNSSLTAMAMDDGAGNLSKAEKMRQKQINRRQRQRDSRNLGEGEAKLV